MNHSPFPAPSAPHGPTPPGRAPPATSDGSKAESHKKVGWEWLAGLDAPAVRDRYPVSRRDPPGYPELEDGVEPPDVFGQLCVGPLVVLPADVAEAAVVVAVEFVWAEANPTEAIPTTVATRATAMRE